MKKLIVIALGFVMNPFAFAQPAVLALAYRFDNGTTTGGTMLPYYVNPLLLTSASAFYAGPGVFPLTFPAGVVYVQGPNAPAPQPTDRAAIRENWNSASFNANDHYGFSMTPLGMNTLVVDSINFWTRKSGTGPGTLQLRSSANAFAGAIWTGTNGGADQWVRRSITSGLPSSVTNLDLRLYGYGATLAAGTWRIDSVRVYAHFDGIFNLPIELTRFDGHVVPEGIALDWTTASESENDYFTVMRSENAIDWAPIADIDGAGESQSEIRYGFVDVHPIISMNYYKLRQTDHDGEFEDSETIAVVWQPFDSSSAKVFDESGRFVRDWNGNSEVLSSGFYLLRDKYGNTKKFFAPHRR